MITEHDLQEAIAECEGQRNPTSNTCIKLAAFYTIRDHLFPQVSTQDHFADIGKMVYSGASGPASDYVSETEFGRMVGSLSMDQVLAVMDELMTTLQVLNPKLYAGVLRKLQN